jgi:hypothetical protein
VVRVPAHPSITRRSHCDLELEKNLKAQPVAVEPDEGAAGIIGRTRDAKCALANLPFSSSVSSCFRDREAEARDAILISVVIMQASVFTAANKTYSVGRVAFLAEPRNRRCVAGIA